MNTEQQQISMYERDLTKPSKAATSLLAEFFGISAEALVEGNGFSIPEGPPPQPAKGTRMGPRVHLPDVRKNELAAVQIGGATPELISVTKGKKLLDQLAKSGKRAWIVFENCDPEKQA